MGFDGKFQYTLRKFRGINCESTHRITDVHITAIFDGNFALLCGWATRKRRWSDVFMNDVCLFYSRSKWFVDTSNGRDNDEDQKQ